ncbi:hypothetical protein KSC_071370 [Ktedonobacter sp. SOSP1-52]|uniref:FAD-dependent oxidoreductase n=1 Tax=Ktedonobacter sp. SOSP1-52 TaxID=2778366 RepID=UPI001915F14E|nr:FAD-dependent oxidoreductase [Ktedonobacter sp. SOSP1-52]GHO68245.1 hypothetical protein KSC_071370 [Ktedonobacter sp. SOSP1-52]
MVYHTQVRTSGGQVVISNPDTKLLDYSLLVPTASILHNVYDERIAIIGSGPVGLNAAHVLALLGYSQITIFEEKPTAGGMLALDMPSFGLSSQAREQLLELLLRPGGVLRLRTRIGRDISFDEIRRDFDAVLLAVGVQQQIPIDLPGEDALKGVCSALEILSTRPFSSQGGCAGTVVVLGGSRYTFDVAAHAVEAGARSVHVFYPAPLSELPVTAREQLLRPHERISIHEFTMPKSFLGTEDMNVCGIRCQKTRWVRDDDSSHLAFAPGRGWCYPVEAVIVAIGEAPDLSFLPRGLTIATTCGEELRLTGPFTTLMPGVFAAGDVVHSLESLEEALQEGRDVGLQIHRYLRQQKHSHVEGSDNPGRGNVHLPGSTADKTTQ